MLDSYIDKSMYYMLLLFALSSNLSTAGTSIAMVIGLLLTIVKYVNKPFNIEFDKKLLRGFIVFAITIFIAAICSQNSIISFKHIFATMNRFIPILLVIVFVKKREQLINILLCLSLSIFMDDIMAIWQRIGGLGQPHGFNNTHTFLASHLLAMIPLFWVLAMEEYSLHPRYKAWFSMVAGTSAVVLVLTDTRGAWLAMLAVCVMYALLNRKKQFKILMLVLLALILAFLAFLYIPALQVRVLSIGDMQQTGNSERLLMWQSSWKIFLDYPLIGVGPGEFANFYNNQYISPLAQEQGHTSPHNNFLLYLTETGIVGLSGFVYLFFCVINYFLRQYRNNSQLVLSLAMLLVTVGILGEGLTDHNFGQASIARLYWFILGLAYSAGRLQQHE